MKIIKNFLPKKQFKLIKSILENSKFPYHYQNNYLQEEPEDKQYKGSDYFFCNILFDQTTVSFTSDNENIKNILDPIMIQLNAELLVRARINLYTNQHKHIHSNFHMDQNDEKIKVALYCINTCNGWTEFKTGEKAPSIENSIILFKANEWHKGVTQTDTKRRINININYT